MLVCLKSASDFSEGMSIPIIIRVLEILLEGQSML